MSRLNKNVDCEKLSAMQIMFRGGKAPAYTGEELVGRRSAALGNVDHRKNRCGGFPYVCGLSHDKISRGGLRTARNGQPCLLRIGNLQGNYPLSA